MFVLLQSLAVLGPERAPPAAQQHAAASLYGYEVTQFGNRQVVLVASPSWELESASPVLRHEGIEFPRPTAAQVGGTTQLQFASILDAPDIYATSGSPLKLQMDLKYAAAPPMRVTLQRLPWSKELASQAERQTGGEGPARELFNLFTTNRRLSFVVTEIQIGEAKVALLSAGSGTAAQSAVLEATKPAPKEGTFGGKSPEFSPPSATPPRSIEAAAATASPDEPAGKQVLPAAGSGPVKLIGEID
jgi:hypothetical protein